MHGFKPSPELYHPTVCAYQVAEKYFRLRHQDQYEKTQVQTYHMKLDQMTASNKVSLNQSWCVCVCVHFQDSLRFSLSGSLSLSLSLLRARALSFSLCIFKTNIRLSFVVRVCMRACMRACFTCVWA